MPIRVGDLPIDAEIVIQVDGELRKCVKLHQGLPSAMYDSSCNGAWFLLLDVHVGAENGVAIGKNPVRAWNTTRDNNYANSNVHNFLTNTMINSFDARIRNAIKTVKIPYCVPKGLIGLDDLDISDIRKGNAGLPAKLFLLSGRELGESVKSVYVADDGTRLDAFLIDGDDKYGSKLDIKRRSLFCTAGNSAWSRSTSGFSNVDGRRFAGYISHGGYEELGYYVHETHTIYPCFILPNDFIVPGIPTISGEDRDLGVRTTAPAASYKIADINDGTYTVTEKLNGTILRTYNAVLDNYETITIPADKWLETLNGDYTLTITATDVDGMEVVRTFAFKKAMNTLEFSTKEAIQADEMPIKAILNVQGAMPPGSIFKVEICNNGNDAAPAWEDVTESVKSGEKFFFKNKIKTAEKWGVKVRISLQRGTATGPCYIQSVGGNFD